MAAEQELSADERRALVERRLDELDRLLLGLLPRAERLAMVASVEARVQALGDAVELGGELPVAAPLAATAVNNASRSPRGRRSRLAFSSGVLGIVVASCLVGSPLLLVVLSLFGELLGETFSILLFGLLTALITIGGGLAVVCGGVSLLRLARRGQTATGTGWAITGLCTGAFPLLIGIVGVLSLGATLLPAEHVQVTWNAGPNVPPPTLNSPPPDYASPYGTPLPMTAPAPGFAPMPAPQGWNGEPQKPQLLPPASLPAQPAREPAETSKPKAEPEPAAELED